MGGSLADDQRPPPGPLLLWLLLAACWICWALGVTLPIVELVPFPGLRGEDQLRPAAERLGVLAVRKSTLQTLRVLGDSGHIVAFGMLLVCTIAVPVLKLLAASWALLQCSGAGPVQRAAGHCTEWIPQAVAVLAAMSSYQLLDLFVGLLIVAFCNNDCFEASLRGGFAFFGAYCVLSQVLLLYLARGAGPDGDDHHPVPRDEGSRVAPLLSVDEEQVGAAEAASAGSALLLGGRSSLEFLGEALAGGTGRPRPGGGPPRMEADARAALINGVALVGLVFVGSSEPTLDTAITVDGIALCRQRLGLQHMLAALGSSCWGGWAVTLLLAGSVVAAPLVVAMLAFLGGSRPRRARPRGRTAGRGGDGEEDPVADGPRVHRFTQQLLRGAAVVAPWIMTDVFALSLVTFLFTVQGANLRTTIPGGALLGITSEWFSGFYVALGLGAAGFSLKWKVLQSNSRGRERFRSKSQAGAMYQLVPDLEEEENSEDAEPEDEEGEEEEEEEETQRMTTAACDVEEGAEEERQSLIAPPAAKASRARLLKPVCSRAGAPAGSGSAHAARPTFQKLLRGPLSKTLKPLPRTTAAHMLVSDMDKPLLALELPAPSLSQSNGSSFTAGGAQCLSALPLQDGGGTTGEQGPPCLLRGSSSFKVGIAPVRQPFKEGASPPPSGPRQRSAAEEDGPMWDDWECPENLRGMSNSSSSSGAMVKPPPAPLAPVPLVVPLMAKTTEGEFVELTGHSHRARQVTSGEGASASGEDDEQPGHATMTKVDHLHEDSENEASMSAGESENKLFHISEAECDTHSDLGRDDAGDESNSDHDRSPGCKARRGRRRQRQPHGARKEALATALVHNRLFRVEAAAWILWALCYVCIRGPLELSYMRMNDAFELVLPIFNTELNRTLPATFGDCGSDGSPPALPCVGDAPIYVERLGTGGDLGLIRRPDILVRWVTGINTIHVNDISIVNVGVASLPVDAATSLHVEVRGVIEQLHMSIRVQQCILTACSTVWDNTDGCCEPGRGFKLIVGTTCVDNATGHAQLGPFTVEWFSMDDITLSEGFLGIFREPLTDLAPKVQARVQKITTDIFDRQPVFLNMTFSELVARLWRYNTVAGGTSCADWKPDA